MYMQGFQLTYPVQNSVVILIFDCAEVHAPNPVVQGSTVLSRRTYNEKVKPFPKGKWIQGGN